MCQYDQLSKMAKRGRKEGLTFALQSPSITELPAQLRTSCANRRGSESSYASQLATPSMTDV
jgi:hypothetical protein